MDRLHISKCTGHALLSEIISVSAGSGGTNSHAHVGGRICVVKVGKVPWTFYIMTEVLSTHALLSGFQY